MKTTETEISTSEIGELGVLHLKRFWNSTLHGTNEDKLPQDVNLTRMMLDDIGVGFNETNQFLYENRPSFNAFESWIKEHLNGTLSQEIIDKTNMRISNFLECSENKQSYPLSATMKNCFL